MTKVEVVVAAAQKVDSAEPVGVGVIRIEGAIPRFEGKNWMLEADAYYERQAELLHAVLLMLPQATLRRLLVLMLTEEAVFMRLPIFREGA